MYQWMGFTFLDEGESLDEADDDIDAAVVDAACLFE